MLGVATFNGAAGARICRRRDPGRQVNTPVLLGNADVYEVWRSGKLVESGHHGRVRFRRSDQHLLFGCIALVEPEAAGGMPAPAASTLHAATRRPTMRSAPRWMR